MKSTNASGPRKLRAVGAAPSHKPIRIALIGLRTGPDADLGLRISGMSGMRCTGSFGSIEEAIVGMSDDTPQDQAQVLLIDSSLAGLTGPFGVTLLTNLYPHLTVVVVSVPGNDRRAHEALAAGAHRQIVRTSPVARFIEEIRLAVTTASAARL